MSMPSPPIINPSGVWMGNFVTRNGLVASPIGIICVALDGLSVSRILASTAAMAAAVSGGQRSASVRPSHAKSDRNPNRSSSWSFMKMYRPALSLMKATASVADMNWPNAIDASSGVSE